jgi:hypothetical protein
VFLERVSSLLVAAPRVPFRVALQFACAFDDFRTRTDAEESDDAENEDPSRVSSPLWAPYRVRNHEVKQELHAGDRSSPT